MTCRNNDRRIKITKVRGCFGSLWDARALVLERMLVMALLVEEAVTAYYGRGNVDIGERELA